MRQALPVLDTIGPPTIALADITAAAGIGGGRAMATVIMAANPLRPT